VLDPPEDLVRFAPPETADGSEWTLVMGTNLADDADMGSFATGDADEVTRRSLLLFALESEASAVDPETTQRKSRH
jgi:isoamylase